MITVQNLTKYYHDSQRGEVRAVDDISFTCAAGEIFGLLGPNGAGKTTTLRMLSTLIPPTSGSAVINGYDISEHPDKVRGSLGFLSSTTGLYPRLTPREILIFFARLHGLDKTTANERACSLMDIMDIKKYSDVRCEKLSSGMKQRVSIARAMINDPPVLIFDEPTVGLDVISAAQMLKVIREYRDKGKCIVYSTHIMSEAEKLCNRIGIIHQGRIQAIGSLDQLRELTGERYLEDIFMSFVKDDNQKPTAEL